MSLDTFQVLAVNDRGVGRDELARTVSRRLGDILTRPLSQVRPSRRALPPHLRHFPVPTRGEFEPLAHGRSQLPPVVTDRPGPLAAEIGTASSRAKEGECRWIS